MSLLQTQDLSLTFGYRTLLDGVSFSLNPAQRLALVGSNGSGKSTLMKVLAGIYRPDSGAIIKRRNLRVAYLPQGGMSFGSVSMKLELDSAFDVFHEALVRSDTIGELMKSETDPKQLMNLAAEQEEILEALQHGPFYQRSARIAHISKGLGFSDQDLDRPCNEFSGGWQMRIALAKVLLQEPEVMLLDEPTNYLDLEARWWLRDFLKKSPSAVLLVSHDRTFLDETMSGILEIYQGKTRLYPGSYTAYEAKRALELDQLMEAWKKQQAEIAHLEQFIERFGAKATKARQAQSRAKALEKIELIELPDAVKKVDFRFPPAPPSSELVLELDEVFRSYPAKPVLANVGFQLRNRERLAVVGKNGAGKSTLLRLIAGVDRPDAGRVSTGSKVIAAWFSQDAEDRLDPALTVFDELEKAYPDMREEELRNLLGSFLFSGDDIEKPIGVLSGGEKSRVSLAKILLSRSNFLILDEPTNHLDISARDVLMRALEHFDGTVVFVSHDQDFIARLATRVLEVLPGPPGQPSSHHWYDGDWNYYLWKKGLSPDQQSSLALTERLIHGITPANQKAGKPEASEGKAQYQDDRKKKAEIRKLENREAAILENLEGLDTERRRLQDELGREDVYTNGNECRKRNERLAALELEEAALNQEWEDCSRSLEEMRS